MKIFVNHFDKDKLIEKFNELKDIDFSLFIDDIPKSQDDLSEINILVLQEPNEYFGLHKWAIENKHLFSFILTWDDWVINNCDNAILLPFGHTWFKSDQYEKKHSKEFEITHLRGNLLKTYGHSLRHELFDRQNEIKIPKKFYASYGDRHNIEEARIGKEEVFGGSTFGIAIENTSHNGYFTEKILDCFLMKTIPIYWGCTDIGNYFNIEGIVIFNSVDEVISKINDLPKWYWSLHKEIIEENWNTALKYVDYENNILNKIKEIFKLNNLI